MPLIRVEMFPGRTVDQKREFAAAVTREACRVLKCEPDAVDVMFVDVEKQNWASGGVLLSEKKS